MGLMIAVLLKRRIKCEEIMMDGWNTYYSAPIDSVCTHQLNHCIVESECENITKDTRKGSHNQILYTTLLYHFYCFKRNAVSEAMEYIKEKIWS